MENIIFHVDVNSAFLSWSSVKRLEEDPNAPDLRLVPSAVGGDVEKRHGIITAKSVPAKKYGVETGEPVVKALQKCPELILIPSDFQTYRKYSRSLMSILRTYSDVVEQASIDEAYLEMTESVSAFQKQCGIESQREAAYLLARKLQTEVRETLKFTVNVGISENKLLAKTASDFSKPDKIHTLYPEEIKEKLWPLPIGELHGCGKATAEKLRNIGIRTVGDAAETDLNVLKSLLGEKGGVYIYQSANGLGSRVVHGEREEAKGYSNETTTSSDITSDNYETDAPPLIEMLAGSVSRRMQRDGVYAQTIGVMVKTDDFHRHSRQMTLAESSNQFEVVNQIAQKLMRELLFGEKGIFASGRGIRLIGVSGTNLDHGEYRQMNLFEFMKSGGATETEQGAARKERKATGEEPGSLKENREEHKKRQEKRNSRAEKQRRLEAMLAGIRGKYGEDAVKKGGEFTSGEKDL